MKKEDLIRRLKNLPALNLFAIEIITAIIKENLTMELLKNIQSKTSLGDINFKKGMKNLLENDILVWTPEKSHRKKALYYGSVMLAMGAKQIVKSYENDARKIEIHAKRLLNLRNQGYVDKNKVKNCDAFSSTWSQMGCGYENRHYLNDQGRVINSQYITTENSDLKKKFMARYSKGVKIATAHLYRKAAARYVPQKVPQ